MTVVEEMADFSTRASEESLSPEGRLQVKVRILDALGCAIAGPCTLIGGGRRAPDRAALLNGALVRYLDFTDSYPAAHETFHPSDNLGAPPASGDAC